MALYLNRNVDEAQWWSQLTPYLSPEAAFMIEGTDPQQIPATAITGDVIPVASASNAVSVLVPTNAAQYQLEMVKRGDNADTGTWIVFALNPPEGTR